MADVALTDATVLQSAFANNSFGENITETTSDTAADHNAVFAINGDYCGFRDTGIVIRNGIVYRDEGARQGLAFNRDGTAKVYDETTTAAAQLVADGVWNTLSFGPAVLQEGEVVDGIEDVEVDTNVGNHSIQGEHNSQGDGLDSNGDATISGGTVVVNGPSNDGNGALDVNGEPVSHGRRGRQRGHGGDAGNLVAAVRDPAELRHRCSGRNHQPLADSSGNVVATFVTAKRTASLVFSSAAITAREEYTVYTGGTASVTAGVGDGTLDGGQQQGTVTAGEYTAARGPGGR